MQWILYNPISTIKVGGNIETNNLKMGNYDRLHMLKNVPEIQNRDYKYYKYDENNQYFEMSSLLALGMILIISTVIIFLIIFRRWPGLVAGIITGTLTSVSIYLTLLALKGQKLVYE